MRKSWIVLMLLALALTFAACDGDSGSNSANDGSEAASDDAEGDPDAFCTAAQDFARSIGAAGEAPDFDAMSAALADMEAAAPEEIRSDVTTVKDALEAGLNSDEGNPLAEDDVQESNDRIFEYLEDSDCEPPEDA